MDFVTRDELLALARELPPVEKVLLPMPINKYIWIQGLTGKQRDTWETGLLRGRGKRRRVDSTNIRARLAVQCIVASDTDRTRVYSDDDASQLGNLPSPVLGVIYEACQRLSDTSDADLDELEQSSAEADGNGSPTN
jgi:hypothetical protein